MDAGEVQDALRYARWAAVLQPALGPAHYQVRLAKLLGCWWAASCGGCLCICACVCMRKWLHVHSVCVSVPVCLFVCVCLCLCVVCVYELV